jgi:translation initiation factor 2 beta subunit (eIF-2beta)/eIF-5
MKITKTILAIIMIMASLTAIAQYKKASFLEKDGRTFEIGTDVHFLSGGRSAQQGIHFSFGREMVKRFFYNYDFEITLPSKFSTIATTEVITNYSNTYVKVPITGKSKTGLIFRLNFGYFLKDNEDEKNKIVPFITLGLHYKILGLKLTVDNKDNTTNYYEISTGANESPAGSGGINLGLGGLYKISEKIGIKMNAGYNLEISADPKFNNGAIDVIPYQQFNSHPYLSIGLRYKMNKED